MVLVLPIRSIRFLSLHARGFGQLRQDAGRQFRGGFLQRCLAGDLLGQIDRDRRLPADGQNTTSPAFDGLQFQACPNRNQLTVPGGELAEPLAGQQHVGFSAATRGVVDDRKAQLAAEQRQLGFGRRIDRPLTDVALGHLDRHGRTWSLAKKQSTWADAYSARYSMIRASRNRGAGPASQ